MVAVLHIHVVSDCGARCESSHFCNLGSNASEGRVRFIQKFCLREVERIAEEEEIGAKQAVQELVGRWEREGKRPATDINNEAPREKLGILRPKMKEGLKFDLIILLLRKNFKVNFRSLKVREIIRLC